MMNEPKFDFNRRVENTSCERNDLFKKELCKQFDLSVSEPTVTTNMSTFNMSPYEDGVIRPLLSL